LNNGNVEVLSEHSIQGRAAWSSGGTILFRPAERSPLFRAPASGGRAAPVRALAESDYTESAPAALPDGEISLSSPIKSKISELNSDR
jgi:hypothetical protein